MQEYLQRQRAQIEAYLSVHPDHPRREIMELARAYQCLALKDKNGALSSLDWVAKNAPSPQWKDQGSAVLELLKAQEGRLPPRCPEVPLPTPP